MTLTPTRYLLRSLVHYRRTHLGLFLGAALCTAVLTGALVIGDSVRFSLHRLAEERLGRAEQVMHTGERFFRAELAEDLRRSGFVAAALLRVRGAAVNPAAERRANDVQVLGVDGRFAELFPDSPAATLQPGEVAVNRRLAARLGVAPGDELLLRCEKPQALPRDAPFAALENLQVAGRYRIRAVLSPQQGGRFHLQTHQIEPFTVFVNRDALADELELGGRANLLLSRGGNAETLQRSLADAWQIEDASLYLVPVAPQTLELRSQRVFLEPVILRAVDSLPILHQPVFTYLVNEIRLRDRATPYSFVSAIEPAPFELSDDEIVLNRWAAEDLAARVGDTLSVSYFVLGAGRKLTEQSRTFRLKAVVPLAGRFADPTLMPDLPGLSGRENCRDWDAGFPIDLKKIRDKDEAYWDAYRGTPKAFVSMAFACRSWSNRFGELTGVRFVGVDPDSLRRTLLAALTPAEIGLVPQPVHRAEAADPSVSFSQLFLGLSFFLIVAALLLTALLFSFEAQRRLNETGLLLSLGFPWRRIRRMLLAEAAVVAAAGAFFGILPGLLYHHLILLALKTVWRDVVVGAEIQAYLRLGTLAIAFLAGWAVSLLGLLVVLRRSSNLSAAELYRGLARLPRLRTADYHSRRAALALGLAGAAVALFFGRNKPQDFLTFFLAGVSLMIALMAAVDSFILHYARRPMRSGLEAAGRRNIALNRRRSLTVIGITAAGVFLTLTVGAHRLSPPHNAEDPASGTGGFAFWGQSSLPILFDLNDREEREKLGLSAEFSVLPLRLQEGDDASCLNLHRVSRPPLLGVDPIKLHERQAFSFAQLATGVPAEAPWTALQASGEEAVIPAVADQTVIIWGLGKQVGDTLHYVDEYGRPFAVRLVGGLQNSIFQGNLLIDEQAFVRRFPSTSGYRVLLIDAPQANRTQLEQQLTWALEDYGFEAVATRERLAAFNAVTNTYLSIFMVLGGLGLMIGALGLGVLVHRRVMEQRGELALLRALGFQRPAIRRMLFAEHAALLLAGVFCGATAALTASAPNLLRGEALPPTLWALIVLIPSVGAAALHRTADSALRQDLLPALRHE
ncbi:MAG: ABC transporter permease [candidate division KSB1 bacterium]|nr:ABC transporter permease [candidate division KSB1 bacterium]